MQEKCIINSDRVTPLDFCVRLLAFTFDLNFNVTFQMLKKRNYINNLIDRFDYKNLETKNRMENLRKVINNYIDKKIAEV